MKHGFLSQYFNAVAAKRLSAVEADLLRSHQHEFNGTKELKRLFGNVSGTERKTVPAKFVYLTDADEEPLVDEGSDCFLTWYDARAKSVGRTGRSEYRLYFPTTRVSTCSAEGDLLILGTLANGMSVVLVAEGESTIASQLLWLFGIGDLADLGFSLRDDLDRGRDRISFAERVVLEQIGVEVIEQPPSDLIEKMLVMFRSNFPSTKVFSDYARSTLPSVIPAEDPDAAIMAWMEREELLFRGLERELVAERLEKGFKGDVNSFLSFSLGVHNRRKSRAGSAFEHHLCRVFDECGVRYSRAERTEARSKPDFLFPGINEYRQPAYPSHALTMLGTKTTCKDRWRQVLTEAARIEQKHLLTMEAAISEHQTSEMRVHKIQLVLPRPLHATFSRKQQDSLMNVRDFIGMVKVRQERST